MEVIGRVKLVDQTKEVGASGFRKRDIVVTTDEQYPQYISVQFVQDKCDILDAYKVGDNVKIDINLRGREWTNQQGEVVYFNTIQGWRISKVQTEAPASGQVPPMPPAQVFTPADNFKEEEHDDLPF